MKRSEVLKSLDRIFDMSDEEIFSNTGMIRQTALAAYSLIKRQPTQNQDQSCAKRVRSAIADLTDKLAPSDTLTRDHAVEILRGCLSGKKAGK